MNEYISKEKVIEHLDKCRLDPLFDPDMARICFAISILIENMEAADVQPVKRGKWRQVSVQTDEFNNHLYECTLCRATDRHNINVNVPYCWHCGAKMEE